MTIYYELFDPSFIILGNNRLLLCEEPWELSFAGVGLEWAGPRGGIIRGGLINSRASQLVDRVLHYSPDYSTTVQSTPLQRKVLHYSSEYSTAANEFHCSAEYSSMPICGVVKYSPWRQSTSLQSRVLHYSQSISLQSRVLHYNSEYSTTVQSTPLQ